MPNKDPIIGRNSLNLTREELLPYEGKLLLIGSHSIVVGVQEDRKYNRFQHSQWAAEQKGIKLPLHVNVLFVGMKQAAIGDGIRHALEQPGTEFALKVGDKSGWRAVR